MSIKQTLITCFLISAGFFATKYFWNGDYREYIPSFLVKNQVQDKEENVQDKNKESLEDENKKIGFGTSDR